MTNYLNYLEQQDYEKTIALESKVVICFSADWCPTCKMLTIVLKEYAQKFSGAKFYYIDTDKAEDLASKLNIAHLPAILIYVNGNEVLKKFGFKNKDDTLNILNDVLK